MRMAVFAFVGMHVYGADFEIVVHIFVGAGRQFFEKVFHVQNQKRLGFIDDDGHGGVQTLDIDDAVFDTSLFDFLLNFFGDVDKIQSSRGGELNNMIDNLHIRLCISYF